MVQYDSQNTFKEIHYNGYDIKKVYGNNHLVWEKSSPTPSYKLKVECNGVSYELPWDGNPILTSGETLSLYNSIPTQSYGSYVDFTVGANVTELGESCFQIGKSMYVGNIYIPSNVKTIRYRALRNCNNYNSDGGRVVCEAFNGTMIEDQNFQLCSIQDNLDLSGCNFPYNRLYFVAYSAYNIKNLILPNSLTSLSYAPYSCDTLESVTILATTPPSLDDYSFNKCPTLRAIYVPSESVNDYKTAWSRVSSLIQSIPT